MFLQPSAGPPTPIRFPPIARDRLVNGLRVCSIRQTAVPVVTVTLVTGRGAAADPVDRPGLMGLTVDLLDEGAAGRDAIELADAFTRLGTPLDNDVSSDAATFSFTTLTRFFAPALALLADVVRRPSLTDADFTRVRELRVSRLRQLSSLPAAVADRAFANGVFGLHPYGRGALGTTPALASLRVEDCRTWHASTFGPADATLVVSGDITASVVLNEARAQFDDWAFGELAGAPLPALPDPSRQTLLVDRPGAAQSEVRVGHTGPPRSTAAYYALVTLNAALGGQFSSRLNDNLREKKGITYGVRTGFDFRREGGTFACETSVQTDATSVAIAEMLAEFAAVSGPRPIRGDELERAKNALTRGYVRNFETAANLTRAVVQLSILALPDDTFDRFVPRVSALREDEVLDAAKTFIRPDDCTIVVVGDAGRCRSSLEQFGRDIVETSPQF